MATATAGQGQEPLFDGLPWRDPVGGGPLEPVVTARTPSGLPFCGALRVPGTKLGYPIVDAVVRLTPELARRHAAWLAPLGLEPPPAAGSFQAEDTVASFGFQWAWNARMRTEDDLAWRVARRFRVEPEEFAGRLVLDAGAGAGDQSSWLLDRGARVVSIDLSTAIDVVADKLRMRPNWVGVQGDVTALPFGAGPFEVVYCEGVIQHTADSAATVRELCRVLAPGGRVLATHYGVSRRRIVRLRDGAVNALRRRVSRWGRFELLLATGNLAALAHTPVVGRLVRRAGLAAFSDRMPDFKTTWTNTYDQFGGHAYQRHVTAEEFWGYFAQVPGIERELQDGLVVVARRAPPGGPASEARTGS